MKTITLTLGLILIALSALQSQNIILSHDGNQLSNNETISVFGSPDINDMVIELEVSNNTTANVEISCIRYELDTIPNSNLYMCWANCTVLPFGGTVNMSPGETTDVFGAHCKPNGGVGIERNLYTFYNENNPNDSISFIALYNTSSVGLNSITKSFQHKAYPNPSYGNLKISYHINDEIENTSIHVFDLQSRLVYHQELTNKEGILEIDLPQGSYFYHFAGNSGVSKAVQLIVL